MAITRDNVGTNDSLLKLFEQKVKQKWEEMDHFNKAKFSLRFQASEGNINCISHIYNLAVQAGHTAVKVNVKGKDKIVTAQLGLPGQIGDAVVVRRHRRV
jgi:hypothetical protein